MSTFNVGDKVVFKNPGGVMGELQIKSLITEDILY